MPQLKNAKKALRKSEKRRVHNQNVKENIRFMLKKTRKLNLDKDPKTQESLQAAIKAIDKATQKGILKKNTAARKKSRLIKSLKTAAPETK